MQLLCQRKVQPMRCHQTAQAAPSSARPHRRGNRSTCGRPAGIDAAHNVFVDGHWAFYWSCLEVKKTVDRVSRRLFLRTCRVPSSDSLKLRQHKSAVVELTSPLSMSRTNLHFFSFFLNKVQSGKDGRVQTRPLRHGAYYPASRCSPLPVWLQRLVLSFSDFCVI